MEVREGVETAVGETVAAHQEQVQGAIQAVVQCVTEGEAEAERGV